MGRLFHSGIKTPKLPSFYLDNDLYKFDNKNVVYIAYVGRHHNEPIFKYGKSSKLFQREYVAHRRTFDIFDMVTVKITDNKDIVEEMFERELMIRHLRRTLFIDTKKQTELFSITREFSYEYIEKLLSRIIEDHPSYEVEQLRKEIAELKMQLKNQQ